MNCSSKTIAALLAVASGLLYGASFPPVDWWPVAWIALTPLCIAASRLDPARAAMAGLITGSIAGALVSPWLPGMVGDYFLTRGPMIWIASLAAWMLCGSLYFAAFAAWLSWATARGSVAPVLVGAAWWLCEWVRVHGIVANPWALLGDTQMAWPLPAQTADITGPYGVGAMLAAVAAWWAGLLSPRLRGRNPRAASFAVAVLLVGQLAYGFMRLHGQAESGERVGVALVQGAIPRDRRFVAQHVAANLEQHLELTRGAASTGATLVAWPELALDFYIEDDAVLRERLLDETRAMGIELLAGGLGVRMHDGKPRRTNSVFLARDGELRDRHDKVRLMPFSEAAAFGAWFRDAPDPILAGVAPILLPTRMGEVGVAICSEAMYPESVRALARAGAGILVAPSNDDWFGSRSAAEQQLRAVSMRAIETRRYLLRPTSSGFTALIDPQGRVVGRAPYGVPATLYGDAALSRTVTPYTRLGELTALLPLAIVVLDARQRIRRPTEVTRA
jgi:apolipoprotein N-acyltransferase